MGVMYNVMNPVTLLLLQHTFWAEQRRALDYIVASVVEGLLDNIYLLIEATAVANFSNEDCGTGGVKP